MRFKLFYCLLISVCLLFSSCVTTKKNSPNDSILSTVSTQTIVIKPIVTGTAVFKSNVREKASSSSRIVDILPKGAQVEIIGKEKNWYQVHRTKKDSPSGYIYHKLINLDFENYLGTRGRNKETTAIYSEPSTQAQTALQIEPNTTFDIIGAESNFYKVKGEYFDGYVLAEICVADPENPIAKTGLVEINSPPPAKESVKAARTRSTQKAKSSAYNAPKGTVTPTKKSSVNSNSAVSLFGAFASAFMGGSAQKGSSVPVQSDDDALKEILKSVSASKELAQKTVEIREQMLKALNETRALQSLVGATVSTMNKNYKTASDTARGVCSTGMEKISIKAFINDLSYEPTTSIESASVKIAENGKMLRNLENQIKSEAADFSKLNADQIKNMDSIIQAFSNNLHASNAMYDFSITKSNNVILGIDRAITSYEEKSGPLTVEATKQIGILALATTQLVAQISNIQNNPYAALTVLPRMMEIQEELSDLSTLLSDFKDDYDYIENNSSIIGKQGLDISRIIMTARRKNTQITTTLESYYQKKLELSKRLQASYARQTQEGFQNVEQKVDSVAIAEDILD